MRLNWAKVVLCLLAVAAFIGVPAQAQLTTGSVTGTVTDAQGAVIAKATVTLTNNDTGVTREVETNDQGAFAFDRVRPGMYTLRISSQGFSTAEMKNVEVTVGKVSALGTVALAVGAVTDTVVIEAGAIPLMQAESPQVVGHYGSREVAEINWGLFGADATSFMTPGILPSFGNINTNTGGFGGQITGDAVPTAAGQRARSTQYNVDGHEINDISIGGPSVFIENQDTIAEYQVGVNTFDASQGRMPGAQINITTKSGGNDIHGTGFYSYNASFLRSRSSFESTNRDDKPFFLQQTFGGTVGGPFIKNKWFGFGSYVRYKIPGAALVQGTSTELVLTQPSAIAVATASPNPATIAYRDRGPFTISDGSPICNPSALASQGVAQGWPVPVSLCGISRAVPQNELFWEYTLRMDVVLNKQSFSGRWFDQLDDFCCSGDEDGFWIAIPFRGQSFSFSHTYQFTPTVVNDFRFSFGRFLVNFGGANTEPIGNLRANLSRFNLPSGYEDIGLATNLPQNRLLYNFQWADTVSIVHGRHTLKAGMEVRRNRSTTGFLPNVNGNYNFSTIAQFTANTPGSTNFAAGAFKFQPFETDQFYFFQDDFRVRDNLTLNLGIRYEYVGQPVNTIHDATLAREAAGTAGGAFWNTSIPLEQRIFPKIDADSNNWGPRIGFAYTPRFWKSLFGEDKSVIRGGYSVAYEAAFYNILLNIQTTAPVVFSFTTVQPVVGGATGSDIAAAIPTPVNVFDPRGFTRTIVPDDFASPTVQNWTLGIQREFGSNIVGEIRYVGTKSTGQFQSVNANPLFTNLLADFPALVPSGLVPCPAGGAPSTFTASQAAATVGRVRCDAAALRSRLNSARSIYHGLQTRLDFRNVWNQLTGGVGFVWGKSIDNVSEIFTFGAEDAGSIAFSENPFDYIRHERGLSNHNLGRSFLAHWIWDSPWYRDQQGAIGKVLGGWEYTGQVFLYDGRPWTPMQFFFGSPYCGQDFPFNAAFIGIFETCRPYLADPNAPIETVGAPGTPGVHWWFNDGSMGPLGVARNCCGAYGDGTVLSNMNFIKNTKVGGEGRFNIQFRTTIVNIFNHRNFGTPDTFVDDADLFAGAGSGTFGRPNAKDANGRIVRFGLRVIF